MNSSSPTSPTGDEGVGEFLDLEVDRDVRSPSRPKERDALTEEQTSKSADSRKGRGSMTFPSSSVSNPLEGLSVSSSGQHTVGLDNVRDDCAARHFVCGQS